MGPSRIMVRSGSSGLKMEAGSPGTNAPGKNMKPMFDGTFKEAGAHPETFTLENENGARAIVDTKTATCKSWKTADGKEMITGT